MKTFLAILIFSLYSAVVFAADTECGEAEGVDQLSSFFALLNVDETGKAYLDVVDPQSEIKSEGVFVTVTGCGICDPRRKCGVARTPAKLTRCLQCSPDGRHWYNCYVCCDADCRKLEGQGACGACCDKLHPGPAGQTGAAGE